jgi:hypothetical protein
VNSDRVLYVAYGVSQVLAVVTSPEKFGVTSLTTAHKRPLTGNERRRCQTPRPG